MITSFLASLLFAQAAIPLSNTEARLSACLDQARTDPATAIVTASQWLEGQAGEETSYPQQCLGHSYVSLLRWEAAEQAFLAARDARSAVDLPGRARLGAMAGNAALVAGAADRALAAFEQAQADAGATPLAGEIAADKARALVQLGRNAQAAEALDQARRLAPQHMQAWLLSAALARRMDRLELAREYVATAGSLAPQDVEVGLEAGVIAALQGRDEAARRNWNMVIALGPGSIQAETARAYLAQLGPATQ